MLMKMREAGKDVHVADTPYPAVGAEEVAFLKSKIAASARGRVRVCVHKVNEDKLHEMFIGFDDSTYIRPSLHVGKDESLHVLEGAGDYVFFDDKGKTIDVVSLGTYNSGYQFYCRIPASANHALVLDSKDMLIHETTSGPFQRADTVFLDWSPPEEDKEAAQRYIASIKPKRAKRPLLKMKQLSPEVFVADQSIVSVGRAEMDFLKQKVSESPRKRTRLCAHVGTEAGLHEMFVVYTSATYVRPNLHVNKDESLHILEGEVDFFFYDANGKIVDMIPMGDYQSGKKFYIRVPGNVWHTLRMRTDRLVIHEATPGPFRREDTLWAPWAPEEQDTAGAAQFLDQLKAAAK